MENKPNYYGIIPSNVRYDKRLTPNAKLLYSEITALCNDKGYCWANNKYFADLYEVSTTSISKWISSLIEFGYLTSAINYKEGTKEILHRYLRLVIDPIEEKLNTPIEEKLNTPIEEKLKDNNTINNNTINNNTINKKTYSKLESYFFCSDDWFLIWEKWLEYKSEIKSNYKTNLSESTAYKKLLELSNNNLEIADKIIMQAIENDWKGLYELKNNEKKGSTLNF